MSPPAPSPGRRTPPLGRKEEVAPPPALLPPKKRCGVWLSWNSPAAAAGTAPPPVISQIHAPPAAAAAAVPLALPAPISAPPPQVDAADSDSSSAAAGRKHSSPLPSLAGDKKSYAPPPPAAGEKPPMPPPATQRPKLVKKVRKVVLKKVRKLVPKGTTSAAAAQEETIIAPDAAEEEAAAGLLHLQTVADKVAVAVAIEENQPGEIVAQKPAADLNDELAALPARETAGEATVAAVEPGAEKKAVVSGNGEEIRGEVAMSGWQKVKREVFVGGLHRDATEEDVRAAMAEAGEITEVRLIMDANMENKNRGYCFVRYREPEQARKAVAQLDNVKICGKHCGVKAVEKNGKFKIAQRNPFEDYTHMYYGEKRPFSTLGDNSSYCMGHNPHVWNASNAYASPTSSCSAPPYAFVGHSPLYHHDSSMYLPHSNYYGPEEPWDRVRMRHAGSRGPAGQPHENRYY